jgi:hypothetical protein
LFVNGFHRSGTTVVAAAATDACGGATVTAGDLASHIPTLRRFLRSATARTQPPDRGVDRLTVTESTPEEYGWLLHHVTGDYAFGERAAGSGLLETLVEQVAGDSGAGPVVLKNPWDTGRELALLRHFPDSRVLLVRRKFAAMEDSMARAWKRSATSSGYQRALIGDRAKAAELLGVLMDEQKLAGMVRDAKRRVRREALRLAYTVGRLPLDRVAFISYDELRHDPRTGAGWAAHVLDPEAFASAFAAHTFPEYNRPEGGAVVPRALDRLLALAWRRARARQVRAGLLPPPD